MFFLNKRVLIISRDCLKQNGVTTVQTFSNNPTKMTNIDKTSSVSH